MEDFSVNYVVAVYLGPRRSKVMQLARQLNVLFHVESQLEAIKTLNISNIKRITFVINEYDRESSQLAIECIDKFDLPIEKKIMLRENSGFSYAAWEEVLYTTKDAGFDYAFLIEDDYIPIHQDFINVFHNQFDTKNIAFVCQYWTRNHASISNGMISYAHVRAVIDKRQYNNGGGNILFDIHPGVSYDDAIYNQTNYMNYFLHEGFQCLDVTGYSQSPFLEADGDKLRIYGNLGAPTLIDINSPRIIMSFRAATIDDCATINRIRNSYAQEYLHDSRLFTLEETVEWFNENVGVDKPLQYRMILCNDIVIGYFRISRYSTDTNSCYIGADIDERFTRFKLGYNAYLCYLPVIHIWYPGLKKVMLEVLVTNANAIKLYKKLGFEEIGINPVQVLKNGKYVDSLIMEKIL